MSSNVYFTSDTHFGHTNILKYCNRPFKNIQEHDEALIANWNAKVPQTGTVYHLGDFFMGGYDGEDRANAILKRLNGSIHFLWGNHDKILKQLFQKNLAQTHHHPRTSLGELANIKVDGQSIVLCHYALRVWNKSHRGAWQLWGHSHGTLPDDPTALSIDVGVDCHNYTPVSFEEVRAIMGRKNYVPVDHHKPTDQT